MSSGASWALCYSEGFLHFYFKEVIPADTAVGLWDLNGETLASLDWTDSAAFLSASEASSEIINLISLLNTVQLIQEVCEFGY